MKRLDEIYELFKTLTHTEILEGIRESDICDPKILFFTKLLRQHRYENDIDLDIDMVIGQEENGDNIYIPNDYELSIIEKFCRKGKFLNKT